MITNQSEVLREADSGGYDSQNVCYDMMKRMIWTGNSGTQPAAGNETCGDATLETSIDLGQIWQG